MGSRSHIAVGLRISLGRVSLLVSSASGAPNVKSTNFVQMLECTLKDVGYHFLVDP